MAVPPPQLLPAATAHVDGRLYANASFGVLLRAPRHYWQGEIAYQILSLVSKTLLSVLMLFNVIAVSAFRDSD